MKNKFQEYMKQSPIRSIHGYKETIYEHYTNSDTENN